MDLTASLLVGCVPGVIIGAQLCTVLPGSLVLVPAAEPGTVAGRSPQTPAVYSHCFR